MADYIFQDVVERRRSTAAGRARSTLTLSIVTHTLAAAGLIVVPVIVSTNTLPIPRLRIDTFQMTAWAPPPVPIPRARPASIVTEFPAPTTAPSEIVPETPAPPQIDARSGIESAGDIPGAGILLLAPPPVPPAEPAAATSTTPVRVGGDVKSPLKLRHVAPIYPALAIAARVQGTVIIEATIDPAGKVVDAKVLSQTSLLDAAALEAVRQWAYTPPELNGQPVTVLMTVTVNFRLR